MTGDTVIFLVTNRVTPNNPFYTYYTLENSNFVVLQKTSKHDPISIFLPHRKVELPPQPTPIRHLVPRIMASPLFRPPPNKSWIRP